MPALASDVPGRGRHEGGIVGGEQGGVKGRFGGLGRCSILSRLAAEDFLQRPVSPLRLLLRVRHVSSFPPRATVTRRCDGGGARSSLGPCLGIHVAVGRLRSQSRLGDDVAASCEGLLMPRLQFLDEAQGSPNPLEC